MLVAFLVVVDPLGAVGGIALVNSWIAQTVGQFLVQREGEETLALGEDAVDGTSTDAVVGKVDETHR